ncbi:aspartyl-phosphate phosphatase Spo0E family protein [Ammoniphilus sp. YIM 78166]|uniref:aspartyl-phosphate phosphatase Spo0E family protein n=1 Tax=Ammoniphilus sp. YIM 78166 TaxID=1644106 RepID=UPI00106F251E|nr:aspartyl-phosphate phosphatase Spo0E family protein [Ammoniphilus sp. YIM 78166]
MSDVTTVLSKIEELRTEMHLLVKHKGIKAPEVLLISQELDRVLNEYKDLCIQPKTYRKKERLTSSL